MSIEAAAGFLRNRVTMISLLALFVPLAVLGLVVLSSADTLQVSADKSADRAEVLYGEHVKYTVVFSNDGASDVNLEVVSDTLPAGFTFVSMGVGSDILHDPTGVTGTIVWDQGPYLVPAGDALTVAYNVRATAVVRPEPYQNLAEGRLSTGEIVSDSASVLMVGPELAGDKQASSSEVHLGRPVDYTVTLSNIGTSVAHVSDLTDTLPAGFTFEEMLSGPLPAPSVQGNKLVWTGSFAIPDGDDLQFSYRVIADGEVGQVHTNAVRAAYDGQVSPAFEAGVTLLPFEVFVPLVLRVEAGSTYRLAFDSKPDGGDFDIFAVNADGTEWLNVSDIEGGDLDPDWSPDGTKIVWVHYVNDKGDIYVANADGTGQTVLSDDAKDERGPDWSPDGSQIAYYRRVEDGGELHWEVFWMDATTGLGRTQLTDHDCQSHSPLWSPDGTKLAYVCGLDNYAEIWVMDVATRVHTRLTNNDIPDLAPSWSPDSTQLVFVRYEAADSEIYKMDVATAVATALTTNPYHDYAPDWSPDGTQIVFSTYLDDSYEIAVMDTNGLNVVNLTQTSAGIADYVPMWSPDGTKIVFISNRDGPKDLYVMDADGSNPVRLTDTVADEIGYDWKPQ
jgi:TolB protein